MTDIISDEAIDKFTDLVKQNRRIKLIVSDSFDRLKGYNIVEIYTYAIKQNRVIITDGKLSNELKALLSNEVNVYSSDKEHHKCIYFDEEWFHIEDVII